MNDRELLELAARAAGLRSHWFFGEGEGLQVSRKNEGHRFNWNPLTDDGDALRLAVTRGLVVTPDRENQRTLVSNSAGHEYCAIYWDKLGEMAATRLAITEAAAEIGKSITQPGATSSP
ncbi:hypothetical protein AB9A01_09725 [Pseudomonas aeruginosa]|uniref:hypothetical protein n=1 Tax=Pseudomonas aeruginosa TaxID=287 RepID=UPI0005AB6ED9|nr:hypothetical protein [Pseudomonas aeruginosa]EKJ7937723.1 hypothetical protein [Pseudomonas aeruginosa]EKT8214236.1 hypothetical protein [Pseudomonas aeruginosa]EKU2260850.1 hypothetical protein [Pseudomonas aeruginosa]EKU7696595.1 hypothetical protein [Pseudomonas aeruginosa]EKU7703407.1 hypothetical protein [Pseudomonas aeruginosa]